MSVSAKSYCFFTDSKNMLVPETGIEPVRPLFTKAADFKSALT
jgi:hypothetical protein